MTKRIHRDTCAKPNTSALVEPRLGDFRVRPDGMALQFMQEVDDEDRPVKHFRSVDTLGLLYKSDSISSAQHDAGQQFATDFARAFASGIVTARLDGLPCGTRPGELLVERNARVAGDVREALAAVGGSTGPAGEALWHIVGQGMSIREWALRCCWSGQSRSPKQARTILLGALTLLAGHYGFGPHERTPQQIMMTSRRKKYLRTRHET